MKILFYLAKFPGYGGIETVTDTITRKLSEHGYDINVLSHIQEIWEYTGELPVYHMPDGADYLSQNNVAYAEELISENGYDVIIFQDCYAKNESLIFPIAKRYEVPVLTFEHSAPNHIFVQQYSSLYSFRGILQRLNFIRPLSYVLRKLYILRNSFKYVVLSPQYISEIKHLVGSRYIYKVSSIPNPLLPMAGRTTDKENIILYVGRLVATKRVEQMISCWEGFSQTHPNWEFVIVGDGIQKSMLEAKVLERKLSNVKFIGFANPQPYYQIAKIFWMKSSFEGWPMTLCEAMQNGVVPVCEASFSSLYDIVDDGENGYIVNSGNDADFLERTSMLANDEEMRQRLAVNARDKMTAFGEESVFEQWDNLLKSVMAR